MDKLFGREAAKIGRQILDQAEPFNAAHTTNWGLPCKPTVTRHQRTRVHRSRKIAQHAHDRHACWATFAFSV